MPAQAAVFLTHEQLEVLRNLCIEKQIALALVGQGEHREYSVLEAIWKKTIDALEQF